MAVYSHCRTEFAIGAIKDKTSTATLPKQSEHSLKVFSIGLLLANHPWWDSCLTD